MKFVASIRTFASAIFHRARVEREIDEELRAHIENRASDLERSGLPHAEAERQAKIEFGGYEAAKEESREALGISFIESILGDIRFGFRMLRKSPGFTTVAILTLALGIGANTVIFSAVNGILLKPLPYASSPRLVTIAGYKAMSNGVDVGFSFSSDIWQELQKQVPDIQAMAIYRSPSLTLTGLGPPETLQVASVSGGFFSVMGVRPLLGRPILPSEAWPAGPRVAVLSYAFWRSLFGGAPSIVGKTITLNGEPYKVVGVMPPGFAYPDNRVRVWVPFRLTRKQASASGDMHCIARLEDGATLKGLDAELKTISPRLAATLPGSLRSVEFSAKDLRQVILGRETSPLLILLGAVGFVLLIACANVSALMLARSWSRQHEVAIREALGGTRARIARQFLTESLLLAFAGGACGLLIAVWGIPLLRAIAPAGTPRIDQVRLDAGVLWFTLGASVLAGILFGLAPALQVAAGSSPTTIRERVAASGSAFGGKRPTRFRGALVIFEVALAVILVVGATLVAQSLEKLTSLNRGFRTDHILTMTVNFSPAVCDEASKSNLSRCKLATGEILKRVREVAGVEDAAVSASVPEEGGHLAFELRIEGHRGEIGMGQGDTVGVGTVSPGYFRTLGIRLSKGRGFNAGDTANSPGVAVVNESFARRFLANKPLGKRLEDVSSKSIAQKWLTVVGEVPDFGAEARILGVPEYYVPFQQSPRFPPVNLIVWTAANPTLVTPAVERSIWSVDKNAPVTNLKTMGQIVAGFAGTPRFRALLFGTFAALGLLLAIVGIYGVISYSVSQRMHEVGIRMAMGAQPGDVLRMVLRDGAILAGAGIVIGIGGALALTRLLRSFLFEISPTDPATFAGVAIALAVVALLACYIPARRAARLDPMTVLRQE